ncbi:hypothetical protein NPIL_635801 [Nephila pilipes]|uniref:Uncharacterized protein n=1 Tax=Nephila pilipes TaxID=299642 RepID=A0A8X6MG83_NEPPI|nr:hypothetical protein NPIL_635801 [Nephila pilipes]
MMRDYSGRRHGNRFGGGRIDETKACFTAAGAYLVAMVTSIWRAPPMSGSSPQKGTIVLHPPSNKINPFLSKNCDLISAICIPIGVVAIAM